MTWYREFSTYDSSVKGSRPKGGAKKASHSWTPPRYANPRNAFQKALNGIEDAKSELRASRARGPLYFTTDRVPQKPLRNPGFMGSAIKCSSCGSTQWVRGIPKLCWDCRK